MSISSYIHSCLWTFFDSLRIKINHIRLRDKEFSLFSNDCIGGVILHNCGVEFCTPTINLFFANMKEYIGFLENIEIYKNLPVIQDLSQKLDYPVGVIKCEKYGDISIHFMHYKSFNDAAGTWKKRCRRIDINNAFAILHMSQWSEDGYEILQRFSNLSLKGICLITWPGVLPKDVVWKHSIFIHPENLTYQHGKLLDWKNHFRKRYIDDFDYVSFLNGKKVVVIPPQLGAKI